jgi:hypothetical protein
MLVRVGRRSSTTLRLAQGRVRCDRKTTREGSKTEQAITLMKAPGGTTLKTLMEAFGWQAHSVRGFISGTLTKKMRLTVVSAKSEDGQRTYTTAS